MSSALNLNGAFYFKENKPWWEERAAYEWGQPLCDCSRLPAPPTPALAPEQNQQNIRQSTPYKHTQVNGYLSFRAGVGKLQQ